MNSIPNSPEAEQDIIGALLKDSQKQECRELLDELSSDDFYNSSYGFVFSCVKNMTEQKVTVSLITVSERLEKLGQLDYCGGFVHLAQMQKNFISFTALPGSVRIIQELKESRDLLALGDNIKEAVESKMCNSEILSNIDCSLKNISTNLSGRELEHIKESTNDWFDLLERREQAGGGIVGVSTGFEQLDQALGGFDEESLIVVGGAPSMGKTLFTQALTVNVGIDQNQNTMFFSMEMSGRQLFERFVSGLSNVAPSALRLARFNKEQLGRISEAVSTLERSKIYQTDEQGLSVAQIRSKVRRHKEKHGDLKMIVIDYLGLMKLDKADRHDIAVGNITRELKELAKEVKTPIVLIAQANRTTSRPNMRSLKDSSCIEADADVVMFVHRHEILEPETELKGVTELIIAKDRHNDGNGTIYMEKVNGGFRELSVEQAAMMVQREENRLNPPKEGKTRGYKK